MNMKKILSAGLALSLSLMMLAGCANETTPATDDVQPTGTTPVTESVQPSETTPVEPSESTPAEPSEDVAAEPDPSAPVTQLYYSSDVSEMEGSWTLSQVYAGGSTYDAVENAATFAITFSLDPSELVDEAAYIHNQVYNLTGDLTFGVAAINDALTAEGLDAGYRGSTAWSDFPQGEVVTEGEFYKQPGPPPCASRTWTSAACSWTSWPPAPPLTWTPPSAASSSASTTRASSCWAPARSTWSVPAPRATGPTA